MDILHLTEKNEAGIVTQVVSLLERGGVCVVPTDTVYGLTADCLRESAVKKVFRIKVRSHTTSLPVFVRDITQARRYAYIDAALAQLLAEIWPGQITIVVSKRSVLPDSVTGGAKTVGLRIPDHPFMRKLLAIFPHPLIGTSANLSGSEPAQSASEVQNTFRKRIPRPELVIDAGRLPPSPSSTVLDLTQASNPRILRMGAITKEKLDEFLKQWNKLKT